MQVLKISQGHASWWAGDFHPAETKKLEEFDESDVEQRKVYKVKVQTLLAFHIKVSSVAAFGVRGVFHSPLLSLDWHVSLSVLWASAVTPSLTCAGPRCEPRWLRVSNVLAHASTRRTFYRSGAVTHVERVTAVTKLRESDKAAAVTVEKYIQVFVHRFHSVIWIGSFTIYTFIFNRCKSSVCSVLVLQHIFSVPGNVILPFLPHCI